MKGEGCGWLMVEEDGRLEHLAGYHGERDGRRSREDEARGCNF